MPGIEPRAAGFVSKCANHCAMLPSNKSKMFKSQIFVSFDFDANPRQVAKTPNKRPIFLSLLPSFEFFFLKVNKFAAAAAATAAASLNGC